MGFSSEISARLGVDTSSVAQDMARAKAAFNKGGEDIASEAGKHGDNVGAKLAEGIEHHLVGTRHLSNALATALGLNLETIAEKITAAIVGGSKEGWQEMGRLAEEQFKLLEERAKLVMNPKEFSDHLQKGLRDAQSQMGQTKTTQASGFWEMMLREHSESPEFSRAVLSFFHLVQTEQEKANELSAAGNKVSEADLKILEEKHKAKEAEKALNAALDQDATENLTSSQRILALQELEKKTIEEINSGKLTETDIIAKQNVLREASKKVAAEELAIKQRTQDKERELAKLGTERFEAQRKLTRDSEEFANRQTDRGKTTLGELAELTVNQSAKAKRAYVFGEDSGLSDEAAGAKASAREIEDLQDQAERLRKTGDVGGANQLFDQIATKKDSLVASGFLKSSEGDEFKAMKETLHKDVVDLAKLIAETNTVLAGKFVNQ